MKQKFVTQKQLKKFKVDDEKKDKALVKKALKKKRK